MPGGSRRIFSKPCVQRSALLNLVRPQICRWDTVRPMLESSGEVPSKLLERCNILLKLAFPTPGRREIFFGNTSAQRQLQPRLSHVYIKVLDTSATHL